MRVVAVSALLGIAWLTSRLSSCGQPSVDDEQWLREGVDWEHTPDNRVVVVHRDSDTFDLALVFPRGKREDLWLCRAVEQWIVTGENADGEWWFGSVLDHVGEVTVESSCGWLTTTLVFTGPAHALDELRDAVLEPLEHPRLATAIEASDVSRRFDIVDPDAFTRPSPTDEGDLSVDTHLWLLHALYGGTDLRPPIPASQRAPAGSVFLHPVVEAEASLHALALTAPDVRYVGPDDLSRVSRALPAERREVPEPAIPVWANEDRVELWTQLSVLGATRHQAPYRAADEGLYAVYDRWLADRVAWLNVRSTQSAEGFRARFLRAREAGAPNVTALQGQVLGFGARDSERLVQDGVDYLALTRSVDQSSWSELLERTRAELRSERQRDHELAVQLGDAVDRGVVGDPNEVAWRQLETMDRATFERFLAQEQTGPLTVAREGTADDAAAWASRGLDATFVR